MWDFLGCHFISTVRRHMILTFHEYISAAGAMVVHNPIYLILL